MIKAFVLVQRERDSTLLSTITTQSHSSKGAHTLHKSDIDTSCCYRKSSSSSLVLLLLLLSVVQSTCNYSQKLRFLERGDARPPKVNDIPGSNGSHPLFISSHCFPTLQICLEKHSNFLPDSKKSHRKYELQNAS